MFQKRKINLLTKMLVFVTCAFLIALSAQIGFAETSSAGHNMEMNVDTLVVKDLTNNMIYLPLVLKNFPFTPDAPVLDTIDNADGDGSYSVNWSSPEGADSYALQEADNASFSNPATVYSGSGTSTNISNKDVGTYYYRVQAASSSASSSWSNVEMVTVTVPPPECPQIVAWRGITSQDRAISFEVDQTPQCQLTAESLKINFRDGCGTSRTTIFTTAIPVISSHFDTGSGYSTRVTGDFTSPVTASGTFSYDPGSCLASGTWTAEPNLGTNGTVYALALQADGKILVGGFFTTLGGYRHSNLGRLNSDGTLDTTFNPVVDASVKAIAVQADGKIVIGGSFATVNGQTRYLIARLNSDGSLDTSFNPGNSGSYWDVAALAVQTDGKIVAGGYFDQMGGQSRANIARINSDGSLDTSYNPGAGSRVYALALQADGKLLVGVSAYLNYSMDAPLDRLNTDGSTDSTFSVTVSGAAHNTAVYSLVVQGDGKILVAGKFSELKNAPRDSIGRLNSDGSLDTTFTRESPGSYYHTINALALQADNKILVGGSQIFTSLESEINWGVGRLNSDGSIDSVFNPDGESTVYALLIQTDGKIVLGGSFDELGGQSRYSLARLNSDGTLDTNFP